MNYRWFSRYEPTLGRVTQTVPTKPEVPKQINQAVRLDLECVFIAIPKTGTTSIRAQFSPEGPFLVNTPHLTVREVENFFHAWHLMKNLGKNSIFPTDTSLVGSDIEVLADSKRRFNNLTKFATVRNPFARVLSMYHRREGLRLSNEISFEEFCEKLEFASDTCKFPSRNHCQVDWLIGLDGKTLVVDNILRLENISKDLGDLAGKHPQLSFIREKHLRRNPQSTSSSYRNAFSASARKSIEVLFKRDLEAFSYDF